MKILPSLIGLIIVLLLVAQVMASNGLATAGSQITEMETEIDRYTQENSLLKEQIASASSLLTLSDKAKEYGFSKSSQPVFLTDKLPMALDLK